MQFLTPDFTVIDSEQHPDLEVTTPSVEPIEITYQIEIDEASIMTEDEETMHNSHGELSFRLPRQNLERMRFSGCISRSGGRVSAKISF